MDGAIYAIEKDMTIFHAAELKAIVVEKVCREKVSGFDLSRVQEIDTAGFQLLALARREAEKNQSEIQFRGCSDAVKEILGLYGKTDWINE